MPQHIQRATLVELVSHAGQQCVLSLRTVVLAESFPGLLLRRLHPSQYICREQRPRSVVLGRVAVGIQPAMVGEMAANVGLETDFLVYAHGRIRASFPRPACPSCPRPSPYNRSFEAPRAGRPGS